MRSVKCLYPGATPHNVPHLYVSLGTAMKMRPSPAVEVEVPIKSLHSVSAETSHEVLKQAISVNMAMNMLAVGLRQRSRSTSDMSWDGMTCRP